jgi:hypothetical protein
VSFCKLSNLKSFFIAEILFANLHSNVEFVPTNNGIADCKSPKGFDDSILTIYPKASNHKIDAIRTLQIVSANHQIIFSSDTWNIILTGFREIQLFLNR